jgi:hypothetical protein
MPVPSDRKHPVAEILDERGIFHRWLARKLALSDASLSMRLSGQRRWKPREMSITADLLFVPVDSLFPFDNKSRSTQQCNG